LQELRLATGSTDVLAGLGGNPLPDSYLLLLNTRDKAQIAVLRDSLQSASSVASAQTDMAWLEKLDALVGAGELIVLLVGMLLTFGMLAGIINTIRLQVLTRQDEIEVSRLFGASYPFIRRPFLYFGSIQAVMAAVLAWGIVNGFMFLLDFRLRETLGVFDFAQGLRGLEWKDGLSLMLFGGLLGWVGAMVSVSQQLRALEASRH
jgi:cell division transport system permease protein